MREQRKTTGVISRVARVSLASLAVAAVVAITLLPSGCTSSTRVSESRYLLGATVSIDAYGEDETAVRDVLADAFAAMEEVASELDAYDPESAIAAINASPGTPYELPGAAQEVLDAVEDLGVSEYFSIEMWAVSAIYDFGGNGHVPTEAELHAVRSAHGLDLGGAAKGLALDRGAQVLDRSPEITAALISAGSTSIAVGVKPDGSAWRIGVEDPRDTGVIVAVFEAAAGPLVVSTSGDYQQYFEADGVRYHHILDPGTGRPTRGLRSLTVAGDATSALEADILSTALFVMGAEGAASHAVKHGLAFYLVDDEGRARAVPDPENLVTIEEIADPLP